MHLDIEDGKVAAEERLMKTALRDTPVQWHLAAFKTWPPGRILVVTFVLFVTRSPRFLASSSQCRGRRVPCDDANRAGDA